jgi:hypothetical protein
MERCEAKSKLLEKKRKKVKIIFEIEGILSRKELTEEDIQKLNKLFSALKELD